jgi:trehalose synthase
VEGDPPVVSSACGIRQQVRPGIDGTMVRDANDPSQIAAALRSVLGDPAGRARMARNARRRVRDEFLIFNQVKQNVKLLADLVG